MDSIDEGWVSLYRKSINSQVFQSEGLWKVWTWCLLRANYKNRWIQVKTGRGTTEVNVKRGQFIFGRKTASKELRMKERTVYDRMLKLAQMQNCVIESNTHYSIVTVCNYDAYQSLNPEEATGNPTTNQQPTNTDNKDNKVNKKHGRQKDADPRVKDFFNLWGETFLQETGQSYVFSYGKDGKLIKDLLAVHSLDTLQDALRAFFRDDQCKRRGLTIGIFFQEINRLLSVKALDPLEKARREIKAREMETFAQLSETVNPDP